MEHPNFLTLGNLHLIGGLSNYSTSSVDSSGLSGEYGMGTMSNDLSLGCDCLGKIHYVVRQRVLDKNTR